MKATVDAYDGSVTLYAWDDEDPILQTWQKIFPATLKPMSEMSDDLARHVRYPADLFKVQRAILESLPRDRRRHVLLARRRVGDAGRPDAAGANATRLQPPYYLTMQVPGTDAPAFTLYSTFIPEARGDRSRRAC